MQHSIWNEKYRPQSLEDLIIGEEQKQKFQEYVDTQTIPHIGLFGKQGSGKTTLAKIFVKNIDCDFLYLNATEDRSMDVIKEKVGGFASSNSFKPIKIVILDECLDENTPVTVLRKGKVEKIPIKHLDEKNDLVKSFNENTKEIQWMPFELFYKGEQECYELEFENGEKIVCTESHKWYTDDTNGNPVVVTTKEVIEKGYILSI
jgi:replication factor C small subunit